MCSNLRLKKNFQFIKNNQQVRFSLGGHFFMSFFRKQKNGQNKLVLINSFSFEIMDIINWHPDLVTGFLFSKNDLFFLSCSNQGSILGYSLASQTKHEIYRGYYLLRFVYQLVNIYFYIGRFRISIILVEIYMD